MDFYYVNDKPQITGEHEVHKDGCTYLPDIENRTFLGMFSTCKEAVEKAREKYNNVDGCYFCSYACHSR